MAFLLLSNSEKMAVIDESFCEEATQYRWHINRFGYAYSKISSKSIALHRLVVGLTAESRMNVDHINGDRLDNRKSNLRICSASQNSANRKPHKNNKSGFKGVSIRKNGQIIAEICVQYKKKYLGMFSDPIEAARAYDKAARELHGEFARLNFPDEAA